MPWNSVHFVKVEDDIGVCEEVAIWKEESLCSGNRWLALQDATYAGQLKLVNAMRYEANLGA